MPTDAAHLLLNESHARRLLADWFHLFARPPMVELADDGLSSEPFLLIGDDAALSIGLDGTACLPLPQYVLYESDGTADGNASVLSEVSRHDAFEDAADAAVAAHVRRTLTSLVGRRIDDTPRAYDGRDDADEGDGPRLYCP